MIRLKICYELRKYSKIRNRKYRAQVYFLKFFMYLFIFLSASEALRMYHPNSVVIKV